MSKKKDEDLPRRDFIATSAKVMAGVSAAGILAKAAARESSPGASRDNLRSKLFARLRSAAPDDTDFEVVIIGTGFGAMVAATQLLEKKPDLKLLLIERGLFFFSPERPLPPFLQTQPVQYWPRPDNYRGVKDLLAMLQTNLGNNPVKPKSSPLLRYNLFDEIDILTASGVGGGSLIYSNVTIRPMQDEQTKRYPVMKNWPLELNEDDYVAATEWMKTKRGPLNKIVTRVPAPDGLNVDELDENHKYLYLGRSRALREASEKANIAGWTKHKKWGALDLAVFEYGNGLANGGKGVQTVCERQGRCFVGCLPGARHTLNKLLIDKILTLPSPQGGLAFPNVKLRTLTDVSHIEFVSQNQYKVWLKDPNKPDKTSSFVSGKKVILSAGVLGSTEVLLRSRQGFRGNLNLSSKIGQRFSSNGDFGAFVTNVSIQNDLPAKDRYHMYPTKGPINTSHVLYVNRDGMQINVEDAGVPQMFAPIVRTTLNLLALNSSFPGSEFGKFLKIMNSLWHGKIDKKDKNWNDPLAPLFPGLPDPSQPGSYQTEHEMLQDIFYFNVMGTDEPIGEFSLNNKGKLALKYEIAKQPIFGMIETVLKELSQEMKGTYVGFPLWEGLPKLFPHILRRKATTVHALGGCPMGNSPTEGAVNTKGQVFQGEGGAVYDGLYVMDASIIPGPVAVNPTLTIAALSLKIAKQITL